MMTPKVFDRHQKNEIQCSSLHEWGGMKMRCVYVDKHSGPHRANGIKWLDSVSVGVKR